MSGANKPSKATPSDNKSNGKAPPTNGIPSTSTNKAGIPPPQATGPPYSPPLSPAEEYFTKLLIRPDILHSVATNLHSEDFRSLQQTSKAMSRIIDHTCGSPAAQFLSKYTCDSGGAKTCWCCGIKVCDGCAFKISGPTHHYTTDQPLSYMELNSQRKEAVCADCYLQPWSLLVQERKKRLDGKAEGGTATEVPKKK